MVPASPRHFVDPRPFDPGATEPTGAESEEFYRASSWRLIWWKFRRHRVAVPRPWCSSPSTPWCRSSR